LAGIATRRGVITALRDREAATAAVRSGTGLTWIHFPSMDAADVTLMEDGFHFHALAVEDCVSPL
jgi:hypothetical protein